MTVKGYSLKCTLKIIALHVPINYLNECRIFIEEKKRFPGISFR